MAFVSLSTVSGAGRAANVILGNPFNIFFELTKILEKRKERMARVSAQKPTN
jgi:hypothetical protein